MESGALNTGSHNQTAAVLPDHIRDRMLFIEFTKFLCRSLQGKTFVLDENYLDAFQYSLEAMKHCARLYVIEAGYLPEVSVIKQVRLINSGIYKLYEELTSSSESIKQRVQLILLASEFSIMSRISKCCRPLFDLLRSKSELWSLQELQELEEFQEIREELPMLLSKLSEKGLIRKVFVPTTPELDRLELRYRL